MENKWKIQNYSKNKKRRDLSYHLKIEIKNRKATIQPKDDLFQDHVKIDIRFSLVWHSY